MDTKVSIYNNKLQSLERARREVAKKIERSYLRDNISEFIMLESRYEKIIETMNRIRSRIDGPKLSH